GASLVIAQRQQAQAISRSTKTAPAGSQTTVVPSSAAAWFQQMKATLAANTIALRAPAHAVAKQQAAGERGDKFLGINKSVGSVAGSAVNFLDNKLLASASPDAFDTLQKSFTLLAANVGQALVPAAAKAAMTLQELSHEWDRLSPATKE